MSRAMFAARQATATVGGRHSANLRNERHTVAGAAKEMCRVYHTFVCDIRRTTGAKPQFKAHREGSKREADREDGATAHRGQSKRTGPVSLLRLRRKKPNLH